jgi:quercetin dioxygenase-like cupin family protein
MSRIIGGMAVALVLIAGTLVAQEKTATVTTPSHVTMNPSDIKWGPPPAVLEQKGATFTVLSGDPGQAGSFVVRLKLDAGYRINPHWHPTDEHLTVISGMFQVGMGDTFERTKMKDIAAGGYVLLPAEMKHYAMAKTPTVVQVHGIGPFTLTYVNAADDPSKRAAETSK